MVIINVYKTDDPLGPLTQYRSFRAGEFTRQDVNPQELGAEPTEVAVRKGSLATISNAMIGSLEAGFEMLSNSEAEIDNHPITAQEARDLAEQLKSARVLQF